MKWFIAYVVITGLVAGFLYAVAMTPPKSEDGERHALLAGILWPLTIPLFLGMLCAKALGVRWSA